MLGNLAALLCVLAFAPAFNLQTRPDEYTGSAFGYQA
jgi:hypothetical protein